MLVLSRKLGEQILIGEGIEVVVLEITRDRVELGFAAPRHVWILRSETRQAMPDSFVAQNTES